MCLHSSPPSRPQGYRCLHSSTYLSASGHRCLLESPQLGPRGHMCLHGSPHLVLLFHRSFLSCTLGIMAHRCLCSSHIFAPRPTTLESTKATRTATAFAETSAMSAASLKKSTSAAKTPGTGVPEAPAVSVSVTNILVIDKLT
jgi:hypothetical protein